MASRSYDRRDSGRRDDRRGSRDRKGRRDSPSPPPKPRDQNELPIQFGRVADDNINDDNNVLMKMKKSYHTSPLGCIYKCIDGSRKIKVWTRNFKEVRGICTGYVEAFDKHWNLSMRDVDEVFLKPKKAKTPYLDKIDPDQPLADLPPKEPKKKKTPEEKAAFEAEEAAKRAERERIRAEKALLADVKKEDDPKKGDPDIVKKKKKRSKKKVSRITGQRTVKNLFIRGDNIVMLAILDEDVDTEEEEDKEEDKESGTAN